MSEYVESGLEELLPVFESLVLAKLFERGEIDVIVRRCRQLEYGLQKRVKRARDFAAYADYLGHLYELVHERRKRLDIWEAKEAVSKGLCAKIGSVLGRGCERFPDDGGLWDARLEFAKRRQEGLGVSKLYARLLQLQPTRVELWEEAAHWELNVADSAEDARALAQKALRQIPRSPRLWASFLRLELAIAQRLWDRRQVLLKDEEGGESESPPDEKRPRTDESSEAVSREQLLLLPRIVFANAVEELSKGGEAKDAGEVVASLLALLSDYPVAAGLARQLLDEWRAQLPASPALAEASVQAAIREADAREAREELIVDSADFAGRRWRERLRSGLALFAEAGEAEPSLKARMASAALTFALNSLKDCPQPALLSDAVQAVYGLLDDVAEPVQDTLRMAETLSSLETQGDGGFDSGALALDLLRSGLRRNPDSHLLWSALLRLQVLREGTRKNGKNIKALKKSFNRALASVPTSEWAAIWELGIWAMARLEPSALADLFAASQSPSLPGSLRSTLKPAYLKWAAANLTLVSAHSLFLRLAKDKPVPLQLYLDHLDWLGARKPRKEREWARETIGLALSDWGKESLELWLKALRMAASSGEAEESVSLYARAQRSLRPQLLPNLASEWAAQRSSLLLPQSCS